MQKRLCFDDLMSVLPRRCYARHTCSLYGGRWIEKPASFLSMQPCVSLHSPAESDYCRSLSLQQTYRYRQKHANRYIVFTNTAVLWRCWLGGRKGIRPVKNWVVGCWRGYLSGVRCRLAYGQLMPLPLTVSCYSKIQIGFTFLVLAHPGSPGKRAVKWVCACVCNDASIHSPIFSISLTLITMK